MRGIITTSKQTLEQSTMPIRNQEPGLTEMDQARDMAVGRNHIEAPTVMLMLLDLRGRESLPRHAIA
jgi:hypothetical protein